MTIQISINLQMEWLHCGLKSINKLNYISGVTNVINVFLSWKFSSDRWQRNSGSFQVYIIQFRGKQLWYCHTVPFPCFNVTPLTTSVTQTRLLWCNTTSENNKWMQCSIVHLILSLSLHSTFRSDLHLFSLCKQWGFFFLTSWAWECMQYCDLSSLLTPSTSTLYNEWGEVNVVETRKGVKHSTTKSTIENISNLCFK